MTPLHTFWLSAVPLVIPAVGAAVLKRTYRTDPALERAPVPAPARGVQLGAAACAAAIMVCAPLAGWSVESALALGPLFALAFLTDAAGRVLPDLLTGTLATLGVGLAVAGVGLPISEALIGIAGTAIFMIAFREVAIRLRGPRAFGLGDVKFLIATAAAVPLLHMAWAIVIAAPIALAFLQCVPRAVRSRAATALPFGALFVAGLVAVALVSAATNSFLA